MAKGNFPFEVKKVNDELNKELMQHIQGELKGFLQVGPQKWLMPSLYEIEGPSFYNFKVRPDDVWIVTFPRSGTTFTQEMIWLLSNNLNFQKAKEVNLQERFPFLEFSMLIHDEVKEEVLKGKKIESKEEKFIECFGESLVHVLDNAQGRRFIKTHLPFSLLPPSLLTSGAKVIYVARNPKDVSVSYYHLHKLMNFMKYDGEFKTFWDHFERDLVLWAPYWEHIAEAYDKRNEENLLFLFYENLIKDTPASIREVAKFLDVSLTNDDVDSLASHLNFDNFRKNMAVNFEVVRNLGFLNEKAQGFIRKGKTGSWRESFDEELNARANKWIEENLRRYKIDFPENCQLGD